MYEGVYDAVRFCDYVIFPMNFYFVEKGIEELDGEFCEDLMCYKSHNISLSIGRQDREGWILTMNLYDLLKTMMRI
jgi:hypothetical protein